MYLNMEGKNKEFNFFKEERFMTKDMDKSYDFFGHEREDDVEIEFELEEEPTEEELRNIDENDEENCGEASKLLSFDESDIGRYLSDIGKKSLCTPEEELQYFEKIKNGDLEAKNEFTERNLRLVVSIANRYSGNGMALLDLIQEGNIGLIKAIEKFDVSKGFKFSTYATWWIRQGITRALADHSRTIRVPVHMVDCINRYKRFYAACIQEDGCKPTREEVAKKLNVSLEKVKEIEELIVEPISLYLPIGEDDNTELIEFVPSEGNSVESFVDKKETKEIVNNMLSTLTLKEERIISLRFGIGYDRGYTLEEIGKMFGLTRERIRQIEAKALRKVKRRSMSFINSMTSNGYSC